MKLFASFFRAGCAGSAALMLTACLGGGGGSGTTAEPNSTVPAATPNTPTTSTAQPEPTSPGLPAASTNNTPTIAGTPQTKATVADAYSFEPTASDVDGDALTYQIANKPEWARFDSTTGRLTGIPAAEHVGTYSNVHVTVTDGEATASLTPFTITVDAIALGQATVSWSPPTQNADGSALTDLGGYKVYYGRDADRLDQVVSVSTGVTTTVIENLGAGTWYFAMTSVNSAKIESPKTNSVSKVI